MAVSVSRSFLAVPGLGLRYVIVAFPCSYSLDVSRAFALLGLQVILLSQKPSIFIKSVDTEKNRDSYTAISFLALCCRTPV